MDFVFFILFRIFVLLLCEVDDGSNYGWCTAYLMYNGMCNSCLGICTQMPTHSKTVQVKYSSSCKWCWVSFMYRGDGVADQVLVILNYGIGVIPCNGVWWEHELVEERRLICNGVLLGGSLSLRWRFGTEGKVLVDMQSDQCVVVIHLSEFQTFAVGIWKFWNGRV
jgi:hypothetical protein